MLNFIEEDKKEMKAILVLIDSLNRHNMTCYNKETKVMTQNITEFSENCDVYHNHFIGSTPCMPARRDLFTGRLNFLERGWGGIEPFDVTLPNILKENKIYTHIETDHYHYLELGGEGYCQMFDTWSMQRGQESDPWVSRVIKEEIPEHYGRARPQYELNRKMFKDETLYPTPKTFESACEWLDNNKDADNFFMTLEVFDPHEPFDCPEEYLAMYKDTYKGKRYDWPEYAPVSEPEDAHKHIQNRYAGTLTMTDKWFGKFIEKLKEVGMYDDTLIIFTSDHGHLLGEHGFLAKNYMHQYDELAHIPLLVHNPKQQNRVDKYKLTQNIDVMPTVLEYFGIDVPKTVQGISLYKENNREGVLYGAFGRAVNVATTRYRYLRAPKEDNLPLYQYTAMPTTMREYIGVKNADEIECGRFLPYTNFPVYKIPENKINNKYIKETLLFDMDYDSKQENPIKDSEVETKMTELLKNLLNEYEAPKEQFERLGLVAKKNS